MRDQNARHWLDQIKDQYGENHSKNWEYRYDGKGEDSDRNGLREIDCSNFANRVLGDIGYKIQYQSTGELKAKRRRYYDDVDPKDLKRGDLVLFGGHIGFFDGYDEKGRMQLYSSSGNKLGGRGPMTTPAKWFGPPLKYLRPKDEHFQGDPANHPYKNPYNAKINPSDTGGPQNPIPATGTNAANPADNANRPSSTPSQPAAPKDNSNSKENNSLPGPMFHPDNFYMHSPFAKLNVNSTLAGDSPRKPEQTVLAGAQAQSGEQGPGGLRILDYPNSPDLYPKKPPTIVLAAVEPETVPRPEEIGILNYPSMRKKRDSAIV